MLQRLILILCVAAATRLLIATSAGAQPADELPASHSVQPQLYATGFEFADGTVIDAAGNLFVANYRSRGTIGRITTAGEASVWCVLDTLAPVEEDRAEANGLSFDGEGRLIVADSGGGRLLRISADGQQADVLADRFQGQRFNSVYDVALDSAGNIYFTDPGDSDAENATGSVFRYDIRTKKVTRLDDQLAFPNGVGVTPDQQWLCVSESKKHRILTYQLTPDGTVANRRVLIDFPTESAGNIKGGPFEPDGLVFDARGRLYVGMWEGGVINVVEVPSGRLLRQYDAGGGKVTNCDFHGEYLYVAVAAKEAVFRLKLGVKGLP